MGKDRESKKAYDKRQMVFVAFKLFRQNGDRRNDQDIIDFLNGKVRGEVIKKALRYYMSAQENGKENER